MNTKNLVELIFIIILILIFILDIGITTNMIKIENNKIIIKGDNKDDKLGRNRKK